ncbi:MAG: hypothetical protein GF317_08175 [Candidatus Lokiarchaeota archaeon]|nr:hypothetical protein [Candidatus Lokiarchaeota archaeon]MBD3199687.1 hypothetical protein [Candidatus Lokiarchaeota archaeon]
MKLGIVGLGYWGNIILKNLESLGYNDVVICDKELNTKLYKEKYPVVQDYQELESEKVFIITPTSTHYEICSFFIDNGVDIFCEKPLTISSKKAEKLYQSAFSNDAMLFTDWIFTYNSHIEKIKEDYDNGKLGQIESILMNRLNLGPERYDVNARWDLAAHDISIIQYIFSEKPVNIKWMDYKKQQHSTQDDSSLGLIEYKNFVATVNVSWQYMKKVRECVFEFDKYYVTWDDYKKFLQYEDLTNVSYPIYSGSLSYPCSSYKEPLKKSLNAFFSFSEEEMFKQKKLTIDTLKILEE